MAEPENEDEEPVVLDLVDDAVVAGANSPLAGSPDQLGRGRWSRFVSQQFQRRLEAPAYLRVELAELTGG